VTELFDDHRAQRGFLGQLDPVLLELLDETPCGP